MEITLRLSFFRPGKRVILLSIELQLIYLSCGYMNLYLAWEKLYKTFFTCTQPVKYWKEHGSEHIFLNKLLLVEVMAVSGQYRLNKL